MVQKDFPEMNGCVSFVTKKKWKTNFTLFSFVSFRFNPFLNKPWFVRVCSISLLKRLWEKEKLLVTDNFYFFHSVFYPSGELPTNFIEFEMVVCKLFELEESKICRLGKGYELSSFNSFIV